MDPPATFFASSSFNEVATGGQSEEELLTALRKGSFLLKHGRHGRPKAHFFRLAACDNELRWRSASGAVKSVLLASVRDFLPGQATEVFRRHPVREPAASFSLRYIDSSGAVRTLDLTCRDREQYILWYPGLQIAVQRSIEAATANVAGINGNSAAAGASPTSSPQQHSTAAGAVGALQLPLEEVVPGDLFIWGCASNPSFQNRSSTPPLPNKNINNLERRDSNQLSSSSLIPSECWPRRLTPTPVPLNSILDASTASVGRRHAAIVSAQGFLYVLGEGTGGKLGRGHDNPAHFPQRTSRGLPGDGKIIATSCGDEYTAAITPEGQLFTWGRLPGESLPVVLPTLVRGGLTNISVCQVSCGPFHTAAVASDGRLFTWGEGFGGKLGHGDQVTRLQPTHLVALQSMPVLQVACGVWHTAAIVLEPPGLGLQSPISTHVNPPLSPGGGVINNSGTVFEDAPAPPSPINSITKNDLFLPSTPSRSHHRRASSSIPGAQELYQGYQEGRGGSLYTWGGVNEAVAFGDSNGGDGSSGGGGGNYQRRDSNKGCLGHGEIDLYTGQTVPTRVGGPGSQLTGKGVRSVAAGLHLTVALTTTGVVYQMGATGASGNTSSVVAPWEGASAPEPVKGQLGNHFVDAIACGMHHVVVLARPVEKKIGRPIDNSIPTVFTWGRGSEGQLGTGKWDDSPSPVAIEENLKSRRAVAIAAGGATTMVVCDHDVKKFEEVVGGELGSGKQGKEATEIATKTLLALLEPRSSSNTTRPASFSIGGGGNGVLGGSKNSRSGWLLTRDERPPSRSNIFRGSSSFSFTSAASGGAGSSSTGGGGGAGVGGGGGNLTRMSSSSSSLQSLGSSGGGNNNILNNEMSSSYPYSSIISISGISTSTAGTGTATISRRNSLNYHQTSEREGGYNNGGNGGGMVTTRSNLSSCSSPSQPQSQPLSQRSQSQSTGKLDPWNNGIVRPTSPTLGNSTNSTSSTTPATSPPPPSGKRDSGNNCVAAAGSPFSSSLQLNQAGGSSTTSGTKGRYIARLEQRLEALQLNKGGGSSSGRQSAEGDLGDEKLKQSVVESAIQYRESMKRALGTTTSTTSVVPNQPLLPPPRLLLDADAAVGTTTTATTTNSISTAVTPSNPISDPSVLEELLQRKEAELERQQQALAAWAEELRRKEHALQQQQKEDVVEDRAVASSANSQADTPATSAVVAVYTAPGAAAAAVVGGISATAASIAASTPHQGSTAGDFSVHGVPAAAPSTLQQQEGQENNKDGKEENEEEWVEQLELGVTATFIRDLTTGASRLKRLRFSKTHFSAATASAWYHENAARLIPATTATATATADGGSTTTASLPHPPPSVAISESVTTTPSKEVPTVVTTTAAAAVVSGSGGIGGGGRHSRIDSRNMSFDARELSQLHAELLHTSPSPTANTAVMPSLLSTPPPPQMSSSPTLFEKEEGESDALGGGGQQEFHTPLTRIINEDGTGGVRTRGASTGITPSPALESLFDQAATEATTEQQQQQQQHNVEELNEEEDADSSASSDVSLVSASSGGRGRGRGRKSSTIPGGAGNTTTTNTTSGGVLLSPPPPRRPSPTPRRPRSGRGGSAGNNNNKIRSFALSDVLSTASISPTTSARSLDISSGFNRPGSQSPVYSTTAAARGGNSGTSGSGLLRSVAAKIARSIIGGEDYTNISIPSPTTSAASSAEQHQQLFGVQEKEKVISNPTKASSSLTSGAAAPTLVFGGRRPTSAGESSKSRR